MSKVFERAIGMSLSDKVWFFVQEKTEALDLIMKKIHPKPSSALRAGGRELFDVHFTTITGTILLNGGVLTWIRAWPAKSDSGTSHIGNYMH